MNNFETITGLFGGLGLFLYGMTLMGDGLESAAGERLKNILEKLTSNKLMGVIVGAVVTAIIQSSSATTVMIVSFVNAGLMNLMQAAGVILGAHIGTTITAQMVSFKLDAIAPIFIGVGAISLMMCKKKKHKDIASIALGFGILFLGMNLMSGSMKPLGGTEWFQNLIVTFSQNTVLAVLTGIIMTAIIQSSSASTGILVALALAGAINIEVAVPMILGCNVGTCITAILASLGANNAGKKAALIHLVSNFIAAIIFIPLTGVLIKIVQSLNPTDLARQVANAHTIFNITATIIIFPFIGKIVVFIDKLLPDKKIINNEGALYLDKQSLDTPMVAMAQAYKETLRMANIAKENFELAMNSFLKGDCESVGKVYEVEGLINNLEKEITDYLVQIAQLDLPQEDIKSFAPMYHVINDIERIGDHVENIADLAITKTESSIEFGDTALEEIKELYETTLKSFDMSISKYSKEKDICISEIESIENKIDHLEEKFRNTNINRLNDKKCSANCSVIFLDLLSNLERIGDHSNNIGKADIN